MICETEFRKKWSWHPENIPEFVWRDRRKPRKFLVSVVVVPKKFYQCRRDGGSRYKLLGPGGPEGGPGLDYVTYIFVFLGNIIICRLYKLTFSDQAQVTLQLTVSLSDFKIINKCAFPGGVGEGEIFHRARIRSWQPWFYLGISGITSRPLLLQQPYM
jgi:hypothetical protein